MAWNLLGLRTVIYPAPDIAASKEWWTARLGFEPYFDEPFYVGYEVGGYELGLWPSAKVEEGVLTCWGVDDVAGAVAEAVENGSAVHREPEDVGDGIITATVVNPDGVIVGFINNPHFKLPEAGE